MTQNPTINGILAYGSLISDPGEEIEAKIFGRNGKIIAAYTPFPVEYARSSGGRGGAPTLVPFNDGKRVKSQIFQMSVPQTEAADILFRREIDKVSCMKKKYDQSNTNGIKEFPAIEPGQDFEVAFNKNVIEIGCLTNFVGLNRVLFAQLGPNIKPLTAKHLACLAIISVYFSTPGRDGITYLINAKRNGITTLLSLDYEREVLRMTESWCLDQALFHSKKKSKYFFQAKEIRDCIVSKSTH